MSADIGDEDVERLGLTYFEKPLPPTPTEVATATDGVHPAFFIVYVYLISC